MRGCANKSRSSHGRLRQGSRGSIVANKRSVISPAADYSPRWQQGLDSTRNTLKRAGRPSDKLESEGSRILGRADVLAVDHNLAKLGIQHCIGLEVSLAESVRHGISEQRAIGKREERRSIVIAIARPPADLDLPYVAGVPEDKVL
jgi:hypothetical protein